MSCRAKTVGVNRGVGGHSYRPTPDVPILPRQGEVAPQATEGEEASRSFAAALSEAFGRELLSAATPALEKMFAIFSDFGSWIQENKEFVQTFLTIIAVGLAGIAAAILPINLTIAAVLALSAAIAALWQDYQVWKRGGDSFIDWSKWEPGFKAAGAAIKWLKDLLGDMVYRAIAAADVLSRAIIRAMLAAKPIHVGSCNVASYCEQFPQNCPGTP